MRKVKSIGLFFAICIMTFTIGTLTGMEMTLQRQRELQSDLKPFELQIAQLDVKQENVIEEEETEEFEHFLDVSAFSDVLRQDTELVVEEYDLTQNVSTVQRKTLPDRYVGMNREEFLQQMEKYQESPPLYEKEKGFAGMELQSFSRERVVLEKFYQKSEREEGYYLAFMDSKIVVLKEDKKTVYFTTDISSQMLPEELRQQIMQLLYVENEKELFDFLESYSS